MSINDIISQQLSEDRVVLYMKGSADFPQCGFSNLAVHLLRECGAAFKDYDILEDSELRAGIKAFSNWPTIPQLYIDGEFVGGSDIMRELYESGELAELLAEKP